MQECPERDAAAKVTADQRPRVGGACRLKESLRAERLHRAAETVPSIRQLRPCSPEKIWEPFATVRLKRGRALRAAVVPDGTRDAIQPLVQRGEQRRRAGCLMSRLKCAAFGAYSPA